MKNTLLIPLLLYGTTIIAQNAFYDAITISQFVRDGKLRTDTPAVQVYGPILNSYLETPADSTDYNTLLIEFTEDASQNFNPILFDLFDFTLGVAAGAEPISGADRRGFLSSIGNIDVTSFADGLAKFLVARAKEELNVAFFRKFQEYIKRYPEVQVIFPNTYDIITKISSYQYAAFLPALRSAFHLDMNSFSRNLVNLRNLTSSSCPPSKDSICIKRINSIDSFLNIHPVGRTFVAAFLVSDGIMEGRNTVEILNDIANDELCLGQTDNFSNIIRFTNLISNSIRSKKEGQLWITRNEFNKLFENDAAFKIYLGLLYAIDNVKQDPIIFSTSVVDSTLELAELLVKADGVGNTINEFRSNFRDLGLAAAEVSFYTGSIQGDDLVVNESSIIKFAEYAHSLSAFLVKAVTFFDNENSKLANDVHLFALIVDEAVDACYDIQSKNYTSLVLHTSEILDTLLKWDSAFKNDYIKYGTFMASIIEADNSDEVKAAIEAAVLPVGSSSIKRETFSNISLNAFIGPMVGTEYLGAQTEDQWATVVGVTAPLGVAFNWGNYGNGLRDDRPGRDTRKNGNEKGGKSLTLFIPLIDVGSIATFRLSDDSSDVAADIKLENIIAPGLYFYYGFGKIPLSLGIGGQVGPQLREINDIDINVDKNFYMRFGLNLVVDIPFFNFYTQN